MVALVFKGFGGWGGALVFKFGHWMGALLFKFGAWLSAQVFKFGDGWVCCSSGLVIG